VTAVIVRDTICQFFGGPYDAATRTYRTPQVAGLGVVRRAWAKNDDHNDYYLGMPPGTACGSQMVVQLGDGHEQRVAMAGATSGYKKVAYAVTLNLFLRGEVAYAEDAQDSWYALRDALIAKIRTDRTCGSGGFEAGGFQVGEGGEPWIRWHMEEANTSEELSLGYLSIEFEAHEYVEA
jgi:hypothetical protein